MTTIESLQLLELAGETCLETKYFQYNFRGLFWWKYRVTTFLRIKRPGTGPHSFSILFPVKSTFHPAFMYLKDSLTMSSSPNIIHLEVA